MEKIWPEESETLSRLLILAIEANIKFKSIQLISHLSDTKKQKGRLVLRDIKTIYLTFKRFMVHTFKVHSP